MLNNNQNSQSILSKFFKPASQCESIKIGDIFTPTRDPFGFSSGYYYILKSISTDKSIVFASQRIHDIYGYILGTNFTTSPVGMGLHSLASINIKNINVFSGDVPKHYLELLLKDIRLDYLNLERQINLISYLTKGEMQLTNEVWEIVRANHKK
jgi:hypothetical protein